MKTRYLSKDYYLVKQENENKFIEEQYGDVIDWYEIIEQELIET